MTTPYVVAEVLAALPKLPAAATGEWASLQPSLLLVDDILTLEQAAVFGSSKDRPVLFSALAWSHALLTLDRADFGTLLGRTFYGLAILTPGMFLQQERAAGRLGAFSQEPDS